MPWVPELFSAPALQRLEERRRHALATVPFFDGLVAGEPGALIGSFAGEPELHHPVRGRIKGAGPFEVFVGEMNGWFRERNVAVKDVDHVVAERHGFEEVVLHLDGASGRVELPVAVVADKRSDGQVDELRLYFSSRPLTGRDAARPPLLQRDPMLRCPDVVAEHQRALSAGDVDAIVTAFETNGYVREPTGGEDVHEGADSLRAFYERLFPDDGGIGAEHCALIDDGRACALEHNVLRWGETDLAPQAGLAVYVRGPSGRLTAVRVYDDVSLQRM